MALDQLLLERLSANTGNLLDDEELIGEAGSMVRKTKQMHLFHNTPFTIVRWGGVFYR